MRRKRWANGLIGVTCLGAAAFALLWPGEAAVPRHLGLESRRDRLDELLAASKRHRALREVVIDDLAAGRLTLAEAVARCEKIDGQFPQLGAFRHGLEMVFPGSTFPEHLALSLLSNCESKLRDQPERAGPVLARLREELRAFTGSRGEASPGTPGLAVPDGRGPDLERRRSR